MKDNLYIIGKHKFGNATVLCVPKCETMFHILMCTHKLNNVFII